MKWQKAWHSAEGSLGKIAEALAGREGLREILGICQTFFHIKTLHEMAPEAPKKEARDKVNFEFTFDYKAERGGQGTDENSAVKIARVIS